MSRRMRIDFAGAWHHVMNRGARRQVVFHSPCDYALFLDVLAEVTERTGIEVHAYCLMPNHYHLVVRSPNGNLSAALQMLGRAFTLAMNRRHGWDGAIFRGRFVNLLVDDDVHLAMVMAYVHLNPVRAGLVQRPQDARWSSFRAYAGTAKPPPFLTTLVALGMHGSCRGLVEFTGECHRGERVWPEELHVRAGTFASGLPSRVRKVVAGHAERVLEHDICRRLGWPLEAVLRMQLGRTGNPQRQFAAWYLRERGVTVAEASRVLGVSGPAVCQARDRTAARLAQAPFAAWRATLQALEPDRDEKVNS